MDAPGEFMRGYADLIPKRKSGRNPPALQRGIFANGLGPALPLWFMVKFRDGVSG
jgi:hypothetical protein